MKKIIVLIGYLVIIFAILFLYLDYRSGQPFSDSDQAKLFSIEKGEGLKIIAKNLENHNLIKDKNSFIFYTILRNLRKNFLPGEYQIKQNFSVKEILNLLTTPTPNERKIIIIEGWTNNNTASYLEKNRIIDKNDFLTETQNISFYKEKYDFLQNQKIKNLEGFIFPDTYQIKNETTAQEIILRTLNNFNRKVDEQFKNEIIKRQLNFYEVITLASIVEKEAFDQKDKEIVAGIFWKRIGKNMALQADSTINYATGKNVRQASAEDLKIDSLYNTYKYRGLPPGPICNPGLESIRATIFYQESPYWYFLHSIEGKAVYSKTFEEHKQNKNKYLNNKNNFNKKELLIKYKNNEQIYKITADPDEDIEEIIKYYLTQNKIIEIIEPNYIFQEAILPDDPHYQEQWYLNKLEAESVWDITYGKQGDVVIALLDSGVDIYHPDLKNNIWINKKEIPGDKIDNDGNGFVDDINGWDFVNNISDPRPKFYPDYTIAGMNHGTVVAGIMAAKGNNNLGIAGLIWNAKIMPVRVLNNRGEGNLEAVIKGIDYAIKNKADIINLSFVSPNYSNLLFDAIKRAWDNNILIIAAAGNNSSLGGDNLDKNPLYPICLDAGYKENIIIGVTAVDQSDKKADYANYGRSCVDISAPGSKIFSTLFYYPQQNEFKSYYGGYWSGTSLAVPLVSGTAALIKSLNPLISNRELRNIILDTVVSVNYSNRDTGWQDKIGNGRLNTRAAIEKSYQKIVNVPDKQYIVVAPRQGSSPLVKILKSSGIEISSFYAYHQNFRGGVSLATGDLDGDGVRYWSWSGRRPAS